MNIIEPCCYNKQLTEIIERIEGGTNVAHFYSFSDWDVSAIMPFLANYVAYGEITVCMPEARKSALESIKRLLDQTYVDFKTKESRQLVSRLTLITQGSNRDMIYSILGGCDNRLVVCEDNIAFRVIFFNNGTRYYVLQGSINQEKSDATQMYTLTTGKAAYTEAIALIDAKRRVKEIKNWKEAYHRVIESQDYSDI